MKSLIVAAGILIVGGTGASAQLAPWHQNSHPYARHYHGVCQDKAFRLHQYERRAASDGRVNRYERDNIFALQRDLDRTCGRYRWRG